MFGTPLGLVHPVQIYESLLNLVLCGGLIWLHGRRLAAGTVGAAYLMGYAVIRACVEVFRGDYVKIGAAMPGGLKPGQYTSVAIFAAGLIVLYLARRIAKRSAAQPEVN
jgi:phosphatidylglycerol:prolipoprotein diacylglycerol transferase